MQPENPKFIGERISYLKTGNKLSVIITQEISRLKESLLLAWLLAWLLCGVFFVYAVAEASTRDERLFLVVVLAFWSFFMVRIGKVFLWRKAGREMILITPGQLSLKNAWWNYGKARIFYLQNIRDFKVIPHNPTNFMESLDRSFWVMGGDTLEFKSFRKTIRFGKQLNEKEAHALARLITKAIQDFKKK